MRRQRRPRLRLSDLLTEALRSVQVNASKSALVMTGVAVAAATMVTTAGLSATLARQVTDEFDSYRATELVVGVANGATPYDWTDRRDLDAVRRLDGVVDAGVMDPARPVTIHREPGGTPQGVTLQPVDEHSLGIIHPRLAAGGLFGAFHVRRGSPVALLSAAVAARLGVVRTGGAVTIAQRRFTVVGIFDDVDRRDEMLLRVIVPLGSIQTRDDAAGRSPQVLVQTDPGQASVVYRQLASALHPEDPRALLASQALDASGFRRGIEGTVETLVWVVIGVTMLMGTLSIAAAAMSAVYARTAELGLRRVMGALRRHVFAQIVTETLLLGVLGSAAGGLAGLVAVIGVATWNGWSPVVEPGVLAVALLAGATSGLLAGLPPAWRAMGLQPVEALRR